MKVPKIIQLIGGLSSEEKHKIAEQLKSESVGHLYPLFEFLIERVDDNSSNSPEDHKYHLPTAQLFKLLYNREYSKKENYLIRNAIRKLSEKIEAFLIWKEIQESIHQNLNLSNYFLLKSLNERGLVNLFDHEYKKSLEQANESMDYRLAMEMCGLGLDHFLLALHDKEDYARARKTMDLQLGYLSAFYLHTHQRSDFNQLLLQRMLGPGSSTWDSLMPDFTNNDPVLSDQYGEYLRLKSSLFVADSIDRKEVLDKCLKILSNMPDSFNRKEEEVFFCSSILAHQLGREYKFEEASLLYQAIFKVIRPPLDVYQQAALSEWITTLIKSEKIKQANEILSRFEDTTTNHGLTGIRLNMIKSVLLAVNEDVEQLAKVLPSKLGTLPEYLRHFYRFMYSILFCLRNDPESALREIVNLNNTILQQPGNLYLKPILSYFRKYYTALVEEKVPQEKLSKLLTDICNEPDSTLSEYLPIIWLRHQLSNRHL